MRVLSIAAPSASHMLGSVPPPSLSPCGDISPRWGESCPIGGAKSLALPMNSHIVHLSRIDFQGSTGYNRVIYYGMLFLVQRESNTCRIPAVLFGPFGLIVLALRQQGGVLCDQNPTNIPRWNVLRSFFGADFRPDAALAAENP